MDLKHRMQAHTGLTQADCTIRDYILCNPGAIARMNAQQLAQASFTSAASVVRFCKRLGYQGFKEFREDFLAQTELPAGLVDYNYPFDADTPPDDMVQAVLTLEAEAVCATAAMLSAASVQTAAAMLAGARQIFLCAVGTSLMIGQEFAFRMSKLLHPVDVISGDANSSYALRGMGREHCLVLLSYTGENEPIRTAAQEAKKRGTPILTITARPDSPAARAASFTLFLPPLENNDEKISTFASAACEKAVMDVLYACIFQQNYARNLQFIREDAARLKRIRKKVYQLEEKQP